MTSYFARLAERAAAPPIAHAEPVVPSPSVATDADDPFERVEPPVPTGPPPPTEPPKPAVDVPRAMERIEPAPPQRPVADHASTVLRPGVPPEPAAPPVVTARVEPRSVFEPSRRVERPPANAHVQWPLPDPVAAREGESHAEMLEALRRADAFMEHLGLQPSASPERPVTPAPRVEPAPPAPPPAEPPAPARLQPTARVEPAPAPPLSSAVVPAPPEPQLVIGSIQVDVRPPQRAAERPAMRTVVVAPRETGAGRPSRQRFGLGQV